jgi:hypothetical protein
MFSIFHHVLSLPSHISSFHAHHSGVWINCSRISPFSTKEEERILIGMKSCHKKNFEVAVSQIKEVATTERVRKQLDFKFSFDGSLEINEIKNRKRDLLLSEKSKMEDNLADIKLKSKLKTVRQLSLQKRKANNAELKMMRNNALTVSEKKAKEMPDSVKERALETATVLANMRVQAKYEASVKRSQSVDRGTGTGAGAEKSHPAKKAMVGVKIEEEWDFKISNFIPSQSPSSFYPIQCDHPQSPPTLSHSSSSSSASTLLSPHQQYHRVAHHSSASGSGSVNGSAVEREQLGNKSSPARKSPIRPQRWDSSNNSSINSSSSNSSSSSSSNSSSSSSSSSSRSSSSSSSGSSNISGNSSSGSSSSSSSSRDNAQRGGQVSSPSKVAQDSYGSCLDDARHDSEGCNEVEGQGQGEGQCRDRRNKRKRFQVVHYPPHMPPVLVPVQFALPAIAPCVPIRQESSPVRPVKKAYMDEDEGREVSDFAVPLKIAVDAR